MKNLLVLSLAIFFAAPTPEASAQNIIIRRAGESKKKQIALDPFFESGRLWTLTPEQLEKDWKEKGFKWNSELTKDRGMFRREKWGFETLELTLFNSSQTVEEAVFQFTDGKLANVVIQIWNKGDSDRPDLSQADFTKIVTSFVTSLSGTIAPRYNNLGKDQASAAKGERLQWIGKETIAQLEYSGGKEKIRDPFTGREKTGPNFQGEFIRLRLFSSSENKVGGIAAASTGATVNVNRADLVKKVVRETSGDVFIPNIPMIDQGDKGYCAVATASRVLNYYGIPTDQHEIAKVSGNDAGGGGTNPDEMEDAMKKLQGKYHMRFQVLEDRDYSSSKYKRFLTNYNRAAKRMNKRVLDTENYFYFLGGLDAEVMREVNGKGPVFEKFMKIVRENIDKGVPVLWGLQLGKYPENGERAKQFGGGHMRLIIGYNMTKGEIIFSDSWGGGHEKKRMLAADASAATMGLYAMTPSS